MPYHHYTHYIREQEQLISEKRWSEMSDYDQKYEADYSVVRQIIQFKLLRTEPFTREVMDTYHRLYKAYDGESWGEILSRMLPLPPLPTLQFIDEVCGINWNTSKAITPILLRVLHTSDRRINAIDYMDYILSHGGDINLQVNTSHQSILYSYLITSLQVMGFMTEQQQVIDYLTYLLEHGADPLLPDRHGKTILDVLYDADQFTSIHASFKQNLITLLEKYC